MRFQSISLQGSFVLNKRGDAKIFNLQKEDLSAHEMSGQCSLFLNRFRLPNREGGRCNQQVSATVVIQHMGNFQCVRNAELFHVRNVLSGAQRRIVITSCVTLSLIHI